MNEAKQPLRGAFITGTGTGVGKTRITEALAVSLRAKNIRVAAVKPVETGVPADGPQDALALARACGQPALASSQGLIRAPLPLSPAAIVRRGHMEPPSPLSLAAAVRQAASGCDLALIEGAGGLLVPLNEKHTIADLCEALDLPLLFVAPNQLGVLSHTLATMESARSRGLRILAVVLNRLAPEGDSSTEDNGDILQHWLRPVPVLEVPWSFTPQRIEPIARLLLNHA